MNMAPLDHSFVEWKEEFVSQERGSRLVHYFLKDSAGDYVLAVVGTERSVRHMLYVVAEEFSTVSGVDGSVHNGYKWRSRREVVDWLTSMVCKQPLYNDESVGTLHSVSNISCTQGHNLPESNLGQTNLADTMASRDFKRHESDIMWSGVAWACSKQLTHYPEFWRNGTKILMCSFVFVMAKDEDQYLAYLEDMYEDKKGQKKVKVRWFHHNDEIKDVIPLRNFHPKEVFFTPYSQVISAECIDGPAVILTPEHYDKCSASFPQASLAGVHVCCRQFKSNKLKPFLLNKLRGYFNQEILTCLDHIRSPRDLIEDEDFNQREHLKVGGKRARSSRGRQKLLPEHMYVCRRSVLMPRETEFKNLVCPIVEEKPCTEHIDQYFWHNKLLRVNEKIELLCQDSGIRGCWFQCTVLQLLRKQVQVQYDDVLEHGTCENLREWVTATREAMPDKLGMRILGRRTIRPHPPHNQENNILEVGTAVDAWRCDGWWEGVVTRINKNENNCLQIYFPGENLFLNIDMKSVRISQDWVDGRWISIETKPNILITVSKVIKPNSELSSSFPVSKDVEVNSLCSPVHRIYGVAVVNCDHSTSKSDFIHHNDSNDKCILENDDDDDDDEEEEEEDDHRSQDNSGEQGMYIVSDDDHS